MFKIYFSKRFLFVFIFSIIFIIIGCSLFYSLYFSETIIIPYSLEPFDICIDYPIAWKYIKLFYIIFYLLSSIICLNSLFSRFFDSKKSNFPLIHSQKNIVHDKVNSLKLLIGKNYYTNEDIVIHEKGLYQNFLITGTIGSGKTSSAMYPFTSQLIKYNCFSSNKKLGMLILDSKGNYHSQVIKYAKKYNREDDLIIIGLNSKHKYNPLNKPNLKAAVLANRLKTILTLFSKNNSESFWLDKTEQILSEAIKFCRLYNNNYVTFDEIHKIIFNKDYYFEKVTILKNLFRLNKLSESDIYDSLSCINFFEKEFFSLDDRTISILKSEISRITNLFISDYDVLNTFCSSKDLLTFNSFEEVINNGKIVVLSMNISEYKNLSKIIAAYLKLDFQSEVLMRLNSSESFLNPCCFICDEYQEYITETDADFFSQSREAKCINIVSSQSYSSLLNTLQNEHTLKTITQNLINKLWYRTDDIFTIETSQKQFGKEEKEYVSKSISENAKETKFNYLTNSLISNNSNLSESVNTYTKTEFIYDTNFFTRSLETFTCLSFLSLGDYILPPTKIKMLPYFNSPN